MILLASEPLCGISRTFYQQQQKKPRANAAKQEITLPSIESQPHLSNPPKISHGSSSAPLVEAMRACAKEKAACFQIPGHNRGKAAPPSLSAITGMSTFHHDLGDHPAIGFLFSPKGVVLEAQRKAAELFGASETWFLVGGTTCGIQASIMATCAPGETLILPRSSHISTTTGLILSGATPKYINPEYSRDWDLPGGITPSQVEQAIKDLKAESKTAAAVLVTSPTYHGICSNIREIANICHSYGIPVIVDEAHGAHFGFHADLPSHALHQGADLVVQSTHKALTSLTQSSMLHKLGTLVNKDAVSICLQMLQSSSPSYLLLASLDAARAQLSDNRDTIFDIGIDLAARTREEVWRISGISVLDLSCFSSHFPSIDPLRITVGVSELGISGSRAADILFDKFRILPGLVGSKSVTFVVNLGTTNEQIRLLVAGMRHLSSTFYGERGDSTCNLKASISSPFTNATLQLSPREAFFAEKRKVPFGESVGKVSGELIFPYPPGIPILVPGEVVTEEALACLLQAKRMGAAISGAVDQELHSLTVCL